MALMKWSRPHPFRMESDRARRWVPARVALAINSPHVSGVFGHRRGAKTGRPAWPAVAELAELIQCSRRPWLAGRGPCSRTSRAEEFAGDLCMDRSGGAPARLRWRSWRLLPDARSRGSSSRRDWGWLAESLTTAAREGCRVAVINGRTAAGCAGPGQQRPQWLGDMLAGTVMPTCTGGIRVELLSVGLPLRSAWEVFPPTPK